VFILHCSSKKESVVRATFDSGVRQIVRALKGLTRWLIFFSDSVDTERQAVVSQDKGHNVAQFQSKRKSKAKSGRRQSSPLLL
jgi:hypothetical protein